MIIRQTLVVLTALLSASACALAQTFSVGNLTYSVTDKTAGEVDVSSCESYESEIDVPATVSHGGISYKVTGIGITAFSVKSSLRRIGLPEGIRHIGEEAFAYCSQLTSMSLPASVESIGSKAFKYCMNLGNVVIGEGVTSIGDRAFRVCTSLRQITVGATEPPAVGADAFFGVSRRTAVLVPSASLDAYRQAAVWREFNIRPM